MKRIISAFLIVASLFSTAFAEEVSRVDFCVRLADALRLKSDSNISLLRYGDWSTIENEKRNQVSEIIKSGIYMPRGSAFEPNISVNQEDIKSAVFGLMRYASASSGLSYLQGGTIVAIAGDTKTLQVGEKTFYTQKSCLYLSDSAKTLAGFKTSQKVDLIINENENVLLAIDPNISKGIKIKILSGSLYLYNDQDDSFIMTNTKEYHNGVWKESNIKRYSGLSLSPSTLIVCGGKLIKRDELNENYLDRQVTMVLDSQNVLFVKIQ